jgi:hypothetical protein
MVTKKEILKKYGEEIGHKILNNKFMKNITIKLLPSGEEHYPLSDVNRALADIEGEVVEDWD